MAATTFERWPCTVARAVDLVGDGWTMLVLREAFYGEQRFDGFIASLGIPRSTLSTRLRHLVSAGLLQRRRYQSDPERHEYVLTESGRDFFPVMAALMTWGDRWIHHDDTPPVELVHGACGHTLRTDVNCRHCGQPVTLDDTTARVTDQFPADLLANPAIAARFTGSR